MKNKPQCLCVCEACNNDTGEKRLPYCTPCLKKAMHDGFCGKKGGPYVILKHRTSRDKVKRRRNKGHHLDMTKLI